MGRGVREILDILENMIAEAGDLIEAAAPNWSPRRVTPSGAIATKNPDKPSEAPADDRPVFRRLETSERCVSPPVDVDRTSQELRLYGVMTLRRCSS